MKKIVLGLLVVWMAALTADLSAKSGPGPKKSGKCAVKNVIYMIGDGMGLSQVSMMMLENGYRPTAFDRSGNIALIKTYSANNRVTDSAAAGTALASGNKTDNGMLGMGPDGQVFKSIMERAKEEGYQTGLVVTVYLQHATPGAFFAHVPSRGDLDVISEQFVESGVDVALGGQKDGKPLIDALKTKDYRVVYDMNELNGVDRGKVVGLFADEYMPTVMKGRDENYLCNATKKALEILSNNAAGSKKGFMVMIEGSQIDSEGHANNARFRTGCRRCDGFCRHPSRHAGRRDGRSRNFRTVDHEQQDRFHALRKRDRIPVRHDRTYRYVGARLPVRRVRRPDQRDHGQHRPAERNRSVDAAEIVPADFIRYAERSPRPGRAFCVLIGANVVRAAGRKRRRSCGHPFQTQAVGDYRYGTERHGGSGQHRIHQDAVQRVEHAGRDRDADQVVNKRPEQVLPDQPDGFARQNVGFRQQQQVGIHQRDHRDVHCDVGAVPHCDADVGASQRLRVVDAVADHRYALTFPLQLLDVFVFVVGQHFGPVMADAEPFGQRGRCLTAVSGQHGDVDVQPAQLVEGGRRGRFQRIVDNDDGQQSVGRAEIDDACASLLGRFDPHVRFFGRRGALFGHQVAAAEPVVRVAGRKTDSTPGQTDERGHFAGLRFVCRQVVYDGAGQRSCP